jgi:hypothetical protein
MPPVAVAIVEMSECRTVSGAPQGYAPCAAAMNPPADPSATGGGDALATVTYRNGRGKAFLWLYWWTYASGRGPINAILQGRQPIAGRPLSASRPARHPKAGRSAQVTFADPLRRMCVLARQEIGTVVANVKVP